MGNGTILGRSPLIWATAFTGVLNALVLIWNYYNPANPVPDIITAALNTAFVGILALFANSALTPVADARIANGTPVNIQNGVAQSVVVSATSVSGKTVEEITDGGPA